MNGKPLISVAAPAGESAGLSSADKLLAALGLFTFESPEWTIERAAEELQLGVSTTYRYFKSLSDAGLIMAFAAGRYVLGPAITQLDRQTRLLDPLISVAKPIMHNMLQRCGENGVLQLCRLYRHQVMCVHQENAQEHAIPSSYERGKLMPLYRGASSKTILSHLASRTVRAFYKDHAAEMEAASLGANWNEVRRSLKQMRAAGIAITFAELDPGLTGIAAPLFDSEDAVVGSLGFVLNEANPAPSVISKVSALVKTGARLIDASAAAAAAGFHPQPGTK